MPRSTDQPPAIEAHDDASSPGETRKPRKPRRPSSPWQQRFDIIQLLRLDTLAEEVNARRFAELKKKLSGRLTATERKRMKRLVELHESGKLHSLPSDLAAEPRRMERTLVAIFRKMGTRWKWIFKAEDVAEALKQSVPTARRGIYDIEDAYLIAVDRLRTVGRHGGQGPSQYMICWGALRDLVDLLGFQGSLFDFSEDGSENVTAAPCGVPGTPPGRSEGGDFVSPDGGFAQAHRREMASHVSSAPTHHEEAPTHGGRAPTHHEQAPTHSEYPPTHGEKANKIYAGAPGRAGASSFSTSISTSLPPFLAEGRQEKIKKWPMQALRACRIEGPNGPEGLRDPQGVFRIARQHGWSDDQISQLIEQWENGPRIGNVRAWGLGVLAFILTKSTPGTPITMKYSPEYLHAQREQERKKAASKQATDEALARHHREAASQVLADLEFRYGSVLDAMTATDLDELISNAFGEFSVRTFQRGGRDVRAAIWRGALLRELDKQSSAGEGASVSRGDGGATDRPAVPEEV